MHHRRGHLELTVLRRDNLPAPRLAPERAFHAKSVAGKDETMTPRERKDMPWLLGIGIVLMLAVIGAAFFPWH